MLKVQSVVVGLLLIAACKGDETEDDTGDVSETDDGSDTEDTSDTDDGSDTDDTSDTGPAPTVVSMIVHPFQPAVEKGANVQLRAREWLSDGSSRPASGVVSWELVSGPGAVDSSGRLTANEAGSVVVRATLGGQTGQSVALAYGVGPTVTQLAVSPASTTLLSGQSAVLTAQGTLSDGTVGDLAAACTWESDTTGIALAGAAGVVTAVAAGTATVSADCGGGLTGSAAITVLAPGETLPDPALSVTALRATWLGEGALAYEVDLLNTGGQSAPFAVDLSVNAEAAPTAAGDLTVSVPGLAPQQAHTLRLPGRYEGARPASLQSWVVVDRLNALPDTNRADNLAGPVEVVVPAALSADVRVAFYGLTVFGPVESGVEGEIFNDGPDDLVGVAIHFERDQPGTSLYTDLESSDAEYTETVDILAGESYYWVFDYDQAPLDPEEWYSCMYVKAVGFADDDLTNNLSCRTVTEW